MKFKSAPSTTDEEPVKTWNVKWPARFSSEQDKGLFLPTTVSPVKIKPQFRKTSKQSTSEISKTQAQTNVDYNRIRTVPARYVRVSSSRGLSAALFSIFICATLLVYMISLFSTKLRTFENELANRKRVLDSSISANALFQLSHDLRPMQESPGRRRLASIEPVNPRERKGDSNLLLLTEKLRRSVRSLRLLQSFLSSSNRKAFTTNAFNTLAGYQDPLQNLSDMMHKTHEAGDSSATIITIYHVRNERQKSIPTNSPPVVMPNVQRHLSPPPRSLSPPIQSVARSNKPSPPNSSYGTKNVLYKNALNVVGDFVPVDSSIPSSTTGTKRTTSSSAGTQIPPDTKIPKPNAYQKGQSLTRRRGNTLNSVRGQKKLSSPSGMIEIWLLNSGSSLCRVYDVARLPGGKMILPKWMKKHEDVLQQHCGLKDIVFAMKPVDGNKKMMIEKGALNVTGAVRILDKTNMDLFSPIAPRHHMPHFVTDILFPLRASELLQGSGTSIKKLASIRSTTPANSPETTQKAFQDIKPSLFLRRETWEAKPSEWVQRLANFFSHPAVGYALLSEKEGQSRHSSSKKKTVPIWRFRSVLSTDMSLYDSEGLFDSTGKNIVFSRNGLSGTPSWKITGISQKPCRVVVTALTRRGPRALLHLDALKKTAGNYFRSGGLALDFQVVQFEKSNFEKQVKIMQGTNILIATHGAGNANLIFMRRGATVIEVFPFAYRAGPFNSLAETFGLEYKPTMSAPQTSVFKECMNRHESKDEVKQKVFSWWDNAVAMEKTSPWVHRLELEKEFGEPGKSEGMATRRCVRTQQLAFNTKAVAAMAFQAAKQQCSYRQEQPNPMYVIGR